MSIIEETSNKWRGIFAEEASETFEQRYANVWACTDFDRVMQTIGDFFRSSGLPDFVRQDYNAETILKATEDAARELWNRGVLKQFIKVSPFPPNAEVQAELDSLLSGVSPLGRKVAAIQASADEEECQINELVSDWQTLDTRSVRFKWTRTPERKAIFDAAIAAGRI